MSRLLTLTGIAAFTVGVLIIARPQGTPAPVVPMTPIAASPSATTASVPASASATPVAIGPIPPGYRVQIPRLGIDLEIAEGDIERDAIEQKTPEGYAFHLPGTGIPGRGYNSYLYAHARRGMFLSLWNARAGDEVWISTPDGRALRYLVTEVHPRVPPDDVSWARPDPPDQLTLQTSTGPDPGDPRFVVIARPG